MSKIEKVALSTSFHATVGLNFSDEDDQPENA